MLYKKIKQFIKKILIILGLRKDYITIFTNGLLYFSYHCADKKFKTPLTAASIFESENDLRILNFVKKTYFSAIANSSKENQDLWQKSMVHINEKLLDYLKNDQDEKAFGYLNNMFINGATGGFATYGKSIDCEALTNKHLQKNLAVFYMDSLINLAEYLGVIPVENCEQRVWSKSLNYNPDEIIDKIELKLSMPLHFPKFRNGMQAIKTKRGFFNNRDMFYIYVALKIKDLCRDIKNPSICEIGGGIGLLCYYLDQFGIKDYTTVDIIPTSLFSNYFLMQNMKNREFIHFDNENFNKDQSSIKILSPEDFFNITDKKFDIIINCDSFPEIDKQTVIKYLQKISVLSDKFYSVNQEAGQKMYKNGPKQNILPKCIYEISNNSTADQRNFTNISRSLFWIRRGYIEELYNIK